MDLDVAKTIASAVMWVNITGNDSGSITGWYIFRHHLDSWTSDDGEKEEAEAKTKSERGGFLQESCVLASTMWRRCGLPSQFQSTWPHY